MEPTTKKRGKKKIVDDQAIISMFMESVLKNNAEPKNVYQFCADNAISEADFYVHYGSLNSVKEDIWVQLFDHAVAAMQKDENYAGYNQRNKLLTLYFTFFEILTLNRSYIVFQLEGQQQALKNLKSLKGLRNRFKDFIVDTFEFTQDEAWKEKWAKISKPVMAEGAWVNFLMVLKFWIDDTSKGFEKTDILIEKSVNTAMDLANTQPLESLLDLGKFLWKEKMN
ncbi:MAG: hypothetical protein RLZZ500_1410 [Bacteroidota bacterium]|jgi:hypothetical protein